MSTRFDMRFAACLGKKAVVHEVCGAIVRPVDGAFDTQPTNHPLRMPSFKRLISSLVPQGVKDALRVFLKEEMNDGRPR